MATFTESPGSVLDYTFNWASWLQTGETIASASVTSQDLVVGTITTASTTVNVILSGLALGVAYKAKCTITTTGVSVVRTDSREVTIYCEQRTN